MKLLREGEDELPNPPLEPTVDGCLSDAVWPSGITLGVHPSYVIGTVIK